MSTGGSGREHDPAYGPIRERDLDRETLRAAVREVLRDLLPQVVAAARTAPAPADHAPAADSSAPRPQPRPPTAANGVPARVAAPASPARTGTAPAARARTADRRAVGGGARTFAGGGARGPVARSRTPGEGAGAARAAAVPGPPTPDPPASAPATPVAGTVTPTVETVEICDDADLDAFVARLLRLADDPGSRAALRDGRLRFRLARPGAAEPAQPPARRVEKGAVTETQVVEAAKAGMRLVLGRRAVLTPLARDKARSLGVPIDRES